MLALALLASTGGAQAGGTDAYRDFLAENAEAMDRMMAGMHARRSGEVDRDFVAMMIPHHQGAIDMARAQLRHGHDERLRRIAQEIIVTQTQEIEVMRLLSRESRPASKTPDEARPMSSHALHGER